MTCLEKTIESFQSKYSTLLTNLINEVDLNITQSDIINAGNCLLKNKITSLSNFESPVRKSIFVLVNIQQITSIMPNIQKYLFPLNESTAIIITVRLGVSSQAYYIINTFLKREQIIGSSLLPSSQKYITELIELNAIANQFFVGNIPECTSGESSTLINFYPQEYIVIFYNVVGNQKYARAHKNYTDKFGKKFTIALQYY